MNPWKELIDDTFNKPYYIRQKNIYTISFDPKTAKIEKMNIKKSGDIEVLTFKGRVHDIKFFEDIKNQNEVVKNYKNYNKIAISKNLACCLYLKLKEEGIDPIDKTLGMVLLKKFCVMKSRTTYIQPSIQISIH